MIAEIRRIVARSPETLVEDAAGCMAIVVTLMVGLYLPGLV